MNNRFQARNQWNNKRQQQSSSVGIVSQQRSYQNAKAARHSPVQGDTRRQSPARGEFIASSVKQSRKPNKAVQGVKRFPVDQSSHNSQTAELQSPDNRFSNAVYPNHVKTPQRTMYRPKTKYFNSRSGTVNMDASPGASKYTASRAGLSFPSSLPRTGSSTGATKWSAPTSQGTTTYNHRTKQSSSGQVNNRRFVPSSNVATLSTSSRRFTPQQAQVDNVSNARRGYQQINTRTQEVYGTTGNSQIKKQMPVDSTTNNRESPATPSLVSGSLNQWSNPATSQKIESESSPPNTRIKPARSPSEALSGSVSESSSPTLISQNAWSSSFNRNTPHHQQQQEPSSDRNVPTSVVKSVQATHSVEESAIAPAVKTESSQPYGQYQEIRDQQPSTLSTANNWDSKSTSISATSFVPNTATRTSVKHQSMVTLFNENEPIPSFEAMGLARQPSETWSAPNNVELSSISPRKISPKIVNTQSPNTVHKSLARHLIREGTMEQVTKTKIEGNPILKKKQISKMPATNEGSTFDHISVNGLSTKKPQQIYFSKNIDSKPQTVNHGASEGPIVAAGNSKDMTFFSSDTEY
ncbi:uncharacterized protein LOC117341040 isoform X2 [Pecten maximus]|uniref:uncharacterized protein LOC117341040 isoform X2 n=1 Tax=Pecten maximus TaxID=6579 RepID=UPI0014589587|nr:uncharacterized protein LOC117341040 isoform X2 [Pecten maximus]